ncbi:MAG: DUF3987 domain-containing protein [Bacteroidales bacterium]|nr:DUF3987 domain-containing protein [Bacteroidales bacterium]
MKKAVFNPDDWNAAMASSARHTDVEALVSAVEASGIDITAAYSDWLAIGFALVSELGEEGRPLFHRLSRFYPGYDVAEADRQYTVCLRDGSREISIATLFYIAKRHGVSSFSSNSSTGWVEELEENNSGCSCVSTENDTPKSLPTFSQSVRSDLPAIMQRIVSDSVSDVDADILILGSLAVFSACIPNVFGVYDRREVFANLFLYVTARASAGKGRLSLCRHLVAPIHQALRDKYHRQMKKFEAAQAAFVTNRKNALAVQPKEPPFLTLFVPANSTATVVYQTLAQNNGVGLLFETEGDTLANAFNSDLGNYSDGFRKAFHHESISYLRKKDHEFVEIVKPKFSAVLSGTPQQIFNLIPDTENGLFSRFIFYTMPTELVWHDMFASTGVSTADEQFKQIGRDFYSFLKTFSKNPVQFTLSRVQQVQFNAFFEATQLRYARFFGDDIIASVRRLGLILFRFAMILSVLRLIDEKPFSSQKVREGLVCVDADFSTALAMVKVLLVHTSSVFQALPRKQPSYKALKGSKQFADASRSKFFEALPASFNRSTYLAIAQSYGISDKTAERYIAELCKSSQLEHPANGQYNKSS